MVCNAGTPAATTQCMSNDDYNAIEAQITTIMLELDEQCDEDHCPQADWAGCVLRMAGHDFMDFKDGEGGSDGCTDMRDPDNAGLDPCLAVGEFDRSLRDHVYQDWCTRISLADFLVVSAEAVMTVLRDRVSHEEGEALKLDFHESFLFGRTTMTGDACAALFAEGRLPNPEDGCPAVERVFMQNLGLDEAGSAALMGVHSIGRARDENSGYEGFWSDPENQRKFNNNFFASMLAKGWGPQENHPNKHQWNRIDSGSQREMMLNTDLCLVYNNGGEKGLSAADHDCCAWLDTVVIIPTIDAMENHQFCGQDNACILDDDGNLDQDASTLAPCQGGLHERELCCGAGFTAGGGRDCGSPMNPTGLAAHAVEQFAQDDNLWIEAFKAAWKSVTELGATNLRVLTDSCPA